MAAVRVWPEKTARQSFSLLLRRHSDSNDGTSTSTDSPILEHFDVPPVEGGHCDVVIVEVWSVAPDGKRALNAEGTRFGVTMGWEAENALEHLTGQIPVVDLDLSWSPGPRYKHADETQVWKNGEVVLAEIAGKDKQGQPARYSIVMKKEP